MFSPQSKTELKSAVDECLTEEMKGAISKFLKLSPEGDRPGGQHGAIGEWDVSSVNDMSAIFGDALVFNDDISKWDVSGVTNMIRMFAKAQSFNGDISKWDVSKVNDISAMFRVLVFFFLVSPPEENISSLNAF